MSPNVRRSLFLVAALLFAAGLVYGARYRTFSVYTERVIDGEPFVIENEKVPEFRLNIAATFDGASVDRKGRLLGNPYEWVNGTFRLCPT